MQRLCPPIQGHVGDSQLNYVTRLFDTSVRIPQDTKSSQDSLHSDRLLQNHAQIWDIQFAHLHLLEHQVFHGGVGGVAIPHILQASCDPLCTLVPALTSFA